MLIRKTIILALLFTVLAAPVVCLAAEGAWEFDEPGDFQGWLVDPNADASSVSNGSLHLRGKNGLLGIVSPPELTIPSSHNAIRLRIKSENKGTGNVVMGLAGRSGIRYLEFAIEGGLTYRDYRLYLKGFFPSGSVMDRIALYFPADEQEVDIDFIRFYEPTTAQVLAFHWQRFWEPDRIQATTINFITAPWVGRYSLLAALYLLIAVLIMAGLARVWWGARGTVRARLRITGESAFRTVVLSFIVAATIFSLRMDYNWVVIWQDDRESLGGKDVSDRIKAVFVGRGEYYEFLEFVKTVVPGDASVKPALRPESEGYVSYALWSRYYLMPLKVSEKADYIWVESITGAMDVNFDPVSRTLKSGGGVIAFPVKPVGEFAGRGSVYKVIKER